jgi:hypothetical protein
MVPQCGKADVQPRLFGRCSSQFSANGVRDLADASNLEWSPRRRFIVSVTKGPRRRGLAIFF